MGFLTDFGSGIPAGTSVTSDTLLSQTAHAYTLVQLWRDTYFHRITSMMWHSHSWFGLPALLGSDDVNDYNNGKEILLRYYAAYKASLEKQLGSTFIRKLNKSTVFAYRFMRELAEIMTMETEFEPEEVRDKVRHYIILVFRSWG